MNKAVSPKRIIPCLDLFNGRVVKGVNFVKLKDVGDPAETAKLYNDSGADEIVFLDISATVEGRKTFVGMIARAAEQVSIPLAVGGGISELKDFEELFRAGADKISVNSAAVKDPRLLKRAADKFGSERVVLAVDCKGNAKGRFDVWINGGQVNSGLDLVDWAIKAEKSGAGEILLTSMDRDGTKAGYDLESLKLVSDAVSIPVTASGGAGELSHFRDAVAIGGADGLLAASLFHFGILSVKQIKEYLAKEGIPVRM